MSTSDSTKISNLGNHNVRASWNIAENLIKYGFNHSSITLFTDLDRKKIGKTKQNMIDSGMLDEEEERQTIERKCFIKQNSPEYYFLVEFILLYVNFHATDWKEQFDLEAFLKAWNLMQNHSPDIADKTEIDVMFYFCRAMLNTNVENSSTDPDNQSLILYYSKEYHAFYLYDTSDDKPISDTGYIKLKTLREIGTGIEKCPTEDNLFDSAEQKLA